MLMHAPVTFTLIGFGLIQDGSSIARGKYSLGGKGQYPTAQVQKQAFDKLLEVFHANRVRPLDKAEYIQHITGTATPFGDQNFIAFVPDVPTTDTDMHGPFELEAEVYITNGKDAGAIEVSIGERGTFVSPHTLKEHLEELISSSMPPGYRLMTKREFFDAIVAEATAGLAPRLAVPGGEDFAPLA